MIKFYVRRLLRLKIKLQFKRIICYNIYVCPIMFADTSRMKLLYTIKNTVLTLSLPSPVLLVKIKFVFKF